MIPEHRLGVYPSQKAKCESRFQLEQVTASRQPKAESGEPRAKSGTQKTLSPLDHVFLYLSLLEDVFCKQFPANGNNILAESNPKEQDGGESSNDESEAKHVPSCRSVQ